MKSTIFIENSKRTQKPQELFWIWIATQIGILGLIYGAIIVSYGLNFIQSILAAFVGALSFLLVGYISLSGKKGKTTTFNLSRAVFGVKGNYIPTLFGWINLVGWMCVNIITATLTLLTLLGVFNIVTNTFTTIVALITLSLLIALSGFISQDALVKLQSFFYLCIWHTNYNSFNIFINENKLEFFIKNAYRKLDKWFFTCSFNYNSRNWYKLGNCSGRL